MDIFNLNRCLRYRLQQRRLCGCKTGNGHPERRATYVVHADLMAEGDGLGISAVLTADTDL